MLNRAALEQSIRFGLLTDADYPASDDAPPFTASWDRKNYFYPDSPKNYQITQKDHPISPGGSVEIELPGPARNIMGEHKTIRLNHAHLEEDVGLRDAHEGVCLKIIHGIHGIHGMHETSKKHLPRIPQIKNVTQRPIVRR